MHLILRHILLVPTIPYKKIYNDLQDIQLGTLVYIILTHGILNFYTFILIYTHLPMTY